MATPTNQAGGDRQYVSVSGEDEIMRKLDSLVNLSHAERTAIVEAGVPAVEKHLKETMAETGKNGGPIWREHTYPSQDTLFGHEVGHLMDSITHKPGKLRNGGTYVGFPGYMYPIAQWTNWGTFRQPGYLYMEKAWNTLETDQVFNPQRQVANKIIHKHWNETK